MTEKEQPYLMDLDPEDWLLESLTAAVLRLLNDHEYTDSPGWYVFEKQYVEPIERALFAWRTRREENTTP
jgi:hypothetical protein